MQIGKSSKNSNKKSAKPTEKINKKEQQEHTDWNSFLWSLLIYALSLAIFFALTIFLSRVNWMPFDFPQDT